MTSDVIMSGMVRVNSIRAQVMKVQKQQPGQDKPIAPRLPCLRSTVITHLALDTSTCMPRTPEDFKELYISCK